MEATTQQFQQALPSMPFAGEGDYSSFDLLLRTRMKSRRGRKVRPKSKIVIAILEACRTPSVEHWIMIKARLGYETFWSHMSRLLDEGKMVSTVEREAPKGSRSRTYYSVTGEGLRYLEKLKSLQPPVELMA